MDEDLTTMTREELVAEIKKLRTGIRQHRDASGHELCWHHPALWGLLPERTDPLPIVPGLARVHTRLRALSSVARRAGARSAALEEPYTK